MNSCTNSVLIADDDGVTRQILADLLGGQGYQVELAKDGAETWAKLQEIEPQFLLLDWLMPGMSGLEICRRVRERTGAHYAYVILITATATDRRVEEALYSGADDFLTKPVRPSELLARMRAGQRVLDLEAKLQLQATIDPLTGLSNRRFFMDQFEREWVRASRHAVPLSCVVFDLDFFKKVNDQHGHVIGDQALCRVADLLNENRRAHDYVGRYGGEEFCALLPETDELGARRWAERIRTELSKQSVVLGSLAVSLSLSAGVAARTEQQRVEDLVDEADQALLLAKRTGRNRVVSATEVGDSVAGTALSDESKLPLRGLTAADLMTTPLGSV